MDLLEGLRNIESRKLLLLSMNIFTILCPGILIIYYFKPELFESISNIKLILLAVSIDAPVYLGNLFIFTTGSFVFATFMKPDYKIIEEFKSAALMFLVCNFTCFVLFGSLYLSMQYHLSFLKSIGGLFLIVFLFSLIIKFKESKGR